MNEKPGIIKEESERALNTLAGGMLSGEGTISLLGGAGALIFQILYIRHFYYLDSFDETMTMRMGQSYLQWIPTFMPRASYYSFFYIRFTG